MDEEMEDFIEEVDPDYEYDASRFFDFTREESVSEEQEAELWFESAGNYPPSPFIVKLNWGKGIPAEIDTTSCLNLEAGKNVYSIGSNSDGGKDHKVSSPEVNTRLKQNCSTSQVSPKKSVFKCKPKSSTLMKPTASHLAKQNKACNLCSGTRSRFQKSVVKAHERNAENSPRHERVATKRQKLETGYLRKVAQLKHQTSFFHKIVKKVTIPKEPVLETAQRAQKRCFRSKNHSESSQHPKANVQAFKARPLNRKILDRPSFLWPKKCMPQTTGFQVLSSHSNSVMQHQETAVKRQNVADASKQEKCDMQNKLQDCLPDKVFATEGECGCMFNVIQDNYCGTHKSFSHRPPTELFSKLSMKSESESNRTCQPKHPSKFKENSPTPFQHEFWAN